MHQSLVILGSQWGDEGKEKIVDLLANVNYVSVAYQGGHNAGHTLVVDGQKDGSAFDSIGDFASPCSLRDW